MRRHLSAGSVCVVLNLMCAHSARAFSQRTFIPDAISVGAFLVCEAHTFDQQRARASATSVVRLLRLDEGQQRFSESAADGERLGRQGSEGPGEELAVTWVP